MGEAGCRGWREGEDRRKELGGSDERQEGERKGGTPAGGRKGRREEGGEWRGLEGVRDVKGTVG